MEEQFKQLDGRAEFMEFSRLESLQVVWDSLQIKWWTRGDKLEIKILASEMPAEICMIMKLQTLSLHTNSLTGEIPTLIGKLTGLTLFFAWQNSLTNNIPASLSDCQNLQALDLSYNNLTGPMPRQIIGLQNLTKLLLLSDELSGFVRLDMGNCMNLHPFLVNYNKLEGSIPAEIGKLKSLNFLDLSNNHFVRGIPLSISGCEKQEFLDFHLNGLSGLFPDKLPQSLQFVDISSNRFIGQISSSIGLLSELTKLVLRDNQFSGRIPAEILSCSNSSDLAGNRALCMSNRVVTPPDHVGPNIRSKSMMKLTMSVLVSASAVLVPLTVYILIRARLAEAANVTGTGSSGVVYRVGITNGQTLAVKKMWLLGWGSNQSLKLLFYDYYPDGSLSSLLQGAGKGAAEWEARYDVVVGMAHALAYMHHDCVPAILHDQKLRGRADPQMLEMLQTLAVCFLCISTRADERPTMKDVVAMLREIRHVNSTRPEADLKDCLSSVPSPRAHARTIDLQGSSNCSIAFSDDSV
ncbi:hypothetical protein RJ641_000605 [Dillenia turbinata]|uniref:Protein kinase domain-containing protein n=1 Tax=Dillenia turbinata TaxID=194707 RepID=A0AAN8ZRM2_9MAGN